MATNSKTYGKTALIEDIAANTTGITRKDVAQVVDAMLDLITNKLQAGQNVTLTGFGTFKTSYRNARQGVNIRTKQPIDIPARTVARWTPSPNLMGNRSVAAGARGSGGQYARDRAGGRT